MTDETHASIHTNPTEILAQRDSREANRPTPTTTPENRATARQIAGPRRKPPKTTSEPSTPYLTRKRSNTIMATAIATRNRSPERPEAAGEKMTVREVCDDLKISPSTLYDWIATQKGPAFKRLPNGSLRVNRDDYDAWYETLEMTR